MFEEPVELRIEEESKEQSSQDEDSTASILLNHVPPFIKEMSLSRDQRVSSTSEDKAKILVVEDNMYTNMAILSLVKTFIDACDSATDGK